MVPEDAGSGQIPDNPQALGGIGIVTDDVAQHMELRASVLARIGKHCLEGLQVGVNVTQNGAAHQLRD